MAIISAGPAGLMLDHLLRSEGIDCQVIERQIPDHVLSLDLPAHLSALAMVAPPAAREEPCASRDADWRQRQSVDLH